MEENYHLSNMLKDLLLNVKEQNLSREQLEAYRDEIVTLYVQLKWELAEITKKKAIYLVTEAGKTLTETKRNWEATKEGQRELELKQYDGAIREVLASLKSRIFNVI